MKTKKNFNKTAKGKTSGFAPRFRVRQQRIQIVVNPKVFFIVLTKHKKNPAVLGKFLRTEQIV